MVANRLDFNNKLYRLLSGKYNIYPLIEFWVVIVPQKLNYFSLIACNYQGNCTVWECNYPGNCTVEIFWVQKLFWSKIFLSKNFLGQKVFGFKIFLWPKFFFGSKNFFGQLFLVKNLFGSKKFSLKFFLGSKFFWSKKTQLDKNSTSSRSIML